MKKLFIIFILILTTYAFTKTAHYMTVSKTIFSNNGKTLYSASFDSTGIIWNIKTGKAVSRMSGQRGFMTCMAISDKYKLLLTTARDKTIALRRLNGKIIRKIRYHRDAVNYVIIKGRMAATSSDNGEIFLWRFPSMYRIGVFRFKVPGIDTLDISKDSGFLAAGGVDGFIRIINYKRRRFIKKFKAHDDYIYTIKLLPGKKLITTSNTGEVKLWDLKTYKNVKSINIGTGVFSLISINNVLYAGTKNGYIYLINPSALKVLKKYRISNKEITALSYDKFNKILSAGDGSGAVHLLKYGNLKRVKILGR